MVVPFGFSIGDVISGIGLVKDIIKALQNTHGATADYRELNAELRALFTALDGIENLRLSNARDTHELSALNQAVTGCQSCLESFLDKTAKSQGLAGPATLLKDQFRKVQWALCCKNNVATLRSQLSLHTSAITILLATIQLSRASMLDQHHAHSHVRLEQQLGSLQDIQKSLDQSSQATSELTQLLSTVKTLIQKDNSVQLVSEFAIRPLQLNGAPIGENIVVRKELIQAMEESLPPPPTDRQRRVVLYGLGGAGKSQLAREYAILYQKRYTAIFWLNGRSENLLKDAVSQIVDRITRGKAELGAVYSNQFNTNQKLKYVIDWFSREANNEWLIIVDNLDQQLPDVQATIMTPEANQPFDAFRYLPACMHGTILITSRLAFLANQIGARGILVSEATVDESLDIIAASSGRPRDESGAEALAARLGGHPLSLSQAGRYIFETQISIEKYVISFDKLFTTHQVSNGSIDTTFEISYNAMKTKNPNAAYLLQLWGFLDNSDLWYEFFSGVFSPDPSVYDISGEEISVPTGDTGMRRFLNKICQDEHVYNEAIRSLHEFSFTRRNTNMNSNSLHPVIHHWVRHSMPTNDVQSTQIAAIEVCGRTVFQVQLQSAQFGAILQRINPHADQCLRSVSKETTWVYEAWLGLRGLSWLAWLNNNDSVPLMLLRLAVNGCMETYGPKAPSTIRSRFQLAACLSRREEVHFLEEAMAILEDLLQLDPWKQHTLHCGRLTGNIYKQQGKLHEAIECFSQCIKDMKEVNKMDNFTEGIVLLDITRCYLDLELRQDAKAEGCRALALFEKAVGHEHGYTAEAAQIMGILHDLDGAPDLAKPFIYRAILIAGKIYGSSHRFTLYTASVLYKLSLLPSTDWRYQGEKTLRTWKGILSVVRIAVQSLSRPSLSGYKGMMIVEGAIMRENWRTALQGIPQLRLLRSREESAGQEESAMAIEQRTKERSFFRRLKFSRKR